MHQISPLRLRLHVPSISPFFASLPAATKLGQGNVFTGVCDSVHRGGGLPQCMLGRQPPLGPETHPPDQADPPSGTRYPTPGPGRHHPPGTRDPPTPLPRPGRPPWDQRPTSQTRQTPPSTRDPPPRTRQTPPGPETPPGKQMPAYGQWAAGTHPTGMHSCLKKSSF